MPYFNTYNDPYGYGQGHAYPQQQRPGVTNAGDLSGIEPGVFEGDYIDAIHRYDGAGGSTASSFGFNPGTELSNAAGSLWGDIWSGIEGEKSRVHGDDLTIGQALLGGSTQTSNSRDFLYQPQDVFNRQNFYPYLNQLYQVYGQDPTSLVAGFDPVQSLGQRVGAGSSLGLQGNVNQAQGAFGQALNPYSSFNSPLYQNALASTFNPFIRAYQEDIQPLSQRFNEDMNSTLRNFGQNVIPNIRSQAVGVGQVGGSREGIAQGIAGQDLADAVRNQSRGFEDAYRNLNRGFADQFGNVMSQYAQNAYNQGISSRNQALSNAPQLGQFSMMPSQYLQDIGATRQGLSQQYINSPYEFLGRLQALMGQPITLNESQSRGVQQRGVSQGFGDIFGGGGGSMFGGFGG